MGPASRNGLCHQVPSRLFPGPQEVIAPKQFPQSREVASPVPLRHEEQPHPKESSPAFPEPS